MAWRSPAAKARSCPPWSSAPVGRRCCRPSCCAASSSPPALGSKLDTGGGRDRPRKVAGQKSAEGRVRIPVRGARRPQPPSSVDREAAGCPLPPGRRRSVGHDAFSIAPSSFLAGQQMPARHDRLRCQAWALTCVTRFRLIVEYDGRPFMGWQRQAHGRSVQQSIEEAVEAITHEQVTLHAAGRTDAGVHALAMTAHVDIAKAITPHRLADGINAKLRPLPVAILAAEPVDEDFHARFSCTGRRYLYRIANRRAPLALEAGRAWRVPVVLH